MFSQTRSLPESCAATWLAVIAGALLAGCGASAPSSNSASNGASADGGRVLRAEQVRFQQIAPFVRMGGAWGDRSKGAHGSFGEFPGGAKSPPHTHSQPYHGVVISGTMTNPFGTERRPRRMGPGSYWYVPAGEQHVTACVSREPCRFYFHAKQAFDFTVLKKLTARRTAAARSISAPQIRFARMAPFVEMGGAWGDRGKGAHGTFGRFNANSKSPPHTHSRVYHGVVISGVMNNPFGNEPKPPRMTAGSYWYVPAGAPHVTACISSEPCLFYFHAEGAFDFAPVK